MSFAQRHTLNNTRYSTLYWYLDGILKSHLSQTTMMQHLSFSPKPGYAYRRRQRESKSQFFNSEAPHVAEPSRNKYSTKYTMQYTKTHTFKHNTRWKPLGYPFIQSCFVCLFTRNVVDGVRCSTQTQQRQGINPITIGSVLFRGIQHRSHQLTE